MNPTGKGGWVKGKSGNPAGKPKGCKNKTSQEIKELILGQFDIKKFAKWIQKNPDAFYTQVLTKCLPKEVQAEMAGEIRVRVLDCLGPRPDSTK